MRTAGILLLLLIMIAAVAVKAWYPSPSAEGGAVAESVQALKSLIVQQNIEEIRLKQQEEERKTAVTLAKLKREEKIESAAVVYYSAVTLAAFGRLLPVLMFLASSIAGIVYVRSRKVVFEYAGIRTFLSPREVPAVVNASIRVQALAESGKVQAFQEDISRHRIADTALLMKHLRGHLRPEMQIGENQPVAMRGEIPHALNVPTMRTILDGLHQGDPLVLGFDYASGEPITGGFDALYSSFLAGRSGSGKSSWLRGLILQSLVCYPKARFFVLDPHQEHNESLSANMPKTEHFHFLHAGNPRKGLYKFNDLLQERLDQPCKRDPLVLVVDEMSFVSRQKYAPTVQGVLERIANEGRKAGVFALLSSQDTRTRKTGDFRDMLSSSYIFQIKSSQARYLLQDREEVEKVKQIQEPGVALFSPTNNESRLVRVPFCSGADVLYMENLCNKKPLNDLEKQPKQAEISITEQPKTFPVQNPLSDAFRERLNAVGISQNALARLANVPKSSLSVFFNTGKISEEYHSVLDKTLTMLEIEAQEQQEPNESQEKLEVAASV